MTLARVTERDLHCDAKVVRLLEQAISTLHAPLGAHDRSWLVAHVRRMVEQRRFQHGRGLKVARELRGTAIRELRWMKYPTASAREAARLIEQELRRYAAAGLGADRRRGPPLNDPERCIKFQICTALRNGAVPGFEHIRRVLTRWPRNCGRPRVSVGILQSLTLPTEQDKLSE